MTVTQKLDALRMKMKEEGIDAYLIPTDDFHGSEYVGAYFMLRNYMTGFTGSAGTALVMKDSAYLWTDGRYFLQAARQLEGSGIQLMKIGVEGVPKIGEFLEQNIAPGQVLGFDARCMSAEDGEKYRKILEKKGAFLREGDGQHPLDLAGDILEDRPAMSAQPVWELDVKYAGVSRDEKLKMLRGAMAKENCQWHVLTSLSDIAWLLNLRGDDVSYNPVFLSYLVAGPEKTVLFAQKEAFSGELAGRLDKDGVEMRPYGEFYAYLEQIPAGSRVLLNIGSVNHAVLKCLAGASVVNGQNPTTAAKAVKNACEMEHMRNAHIKDGVAVTKFIYWLKMQMKNPDPDHPLTELGAVDKLHEFRALQEHFIEESFDSIVAYGPHGAIMHYSPTEETDVTIKPRSFLLVDSGGQYLEGTTDITRTIACGPLSQEEKEYYTRVLRGNLGLGSVKFLHGCTGMAFDYLARSPLWEIGEDYNHGTGHGVGFLLNVHENPNNFSYKQTPGRPLPCVLEEGMVTSNEPGYYLEGKFGVRCENLTMCVKDEKTQYGQFMRLDTLTLVPWEPEAVIVSMLSPKERDLLNAYHAKVYELISPFLDEDERAWLKEETKAI